MASRKSITRTALRAMVQGSSSSTKRKPGDVLNHYSLFKVNGEPVYLSHVEFLIFIYPNRLELIEQLTSGMQLESIDEGDRLEYVMVPGNKNPGNYNVGHPVVRFEITSLDNKYIKGPDEIRTYPYLRCVYTASLENL